MHTRATKFSILWHESVATDTLGVCIAFGNDDYAHDHRARLAVTLLRQHLADVHLVEMGFGTSHDGQCWVLVIQANDGQALTEAVLPARSVASGVGQ
jgi:hypothetical protein